jgi:hypothetical protein
MLQNLDDQVRDCLQRAAECAERANETKRIPYERDAWLSLHGRYLALANGIEGGHRDRRRIRGATVVRRV